MQHAAKPMVSDDDAIFQLAALSSALAPIFRGRFCDILLENRAARTFDKSEAIYEVGDRERTLFFIRRVVVKTGTITELGREIIYDIRKDADVVGELCALEPVRRDRAVAVERTEAVAVAFDEVVDTLAKHPALLRDFVEELAQMVIARRERVSTALNSLRRRGIAQYSQRGHLLLDMRALEAYMSPTG